jgi:hypothetical protein
VALSTANSKLKAAEEQHQFVNSKNVEVTAIPPRSRPKCAVRSIRRIRDHYPAPAAANLRFADCCIFLAHTGDNYCVPSAVNNLCFADDCCNLVVSLSLSIYLSISLSLSLSLSQLERENQRLVSEVGRLEEASRRAGAQTTALSGTPKSSSSSASPRVLQQFHGPPGGASGVSAHAVRRGDAVSHPEVRAGWRSRALLGEAFALWGEQARFMRMSGLRERFSSLNWFVGRKGGVGAELGNVPVGRLTKQVVTLSPKKSGGFFFLLIFRNFLGLADVFGVMCAPFAGLEHHGVCSRRRCVCDGRRRRVEDPVRHQKDETGRQQGETRCLGPSKCLDHTLNSRP